MNGRVPRLNSEGLALHQRLGAIRLGHCPIDISLDDGRRPRDETKRRCGMLRRAAVREKTLAKTTALFRPGSGRLVQCFCFQFFFDALGNGHSRGAHIRDLDGNGARYIDFLTVARLLAGKSVLIF